MKSPVTGEKKILHTFSKRVIKEDPGSYQPTSLTYMSSKIMEQILLKVTVKHTEQRQVIRENQHGFTKGKSCLTHLMVAFYDAE